MALFCMVHNFKLHLSAFSYLRKSTLSKRDSITCWVFGFFYLFVWVLFGGSLLGSRLVPCFVLRDDLMVVPRIKEEFALQGKILNCCAMSVASYNCYGDNVVFKTVCPFCFIDGSALPLHTKSITCFIDTVCLYKPQSPQSWLAYLPHSASSVYCSDKCISKFVPISSEFICPSFILFLYNHK